MNLADGFLKEVDEHLRQERMLNIWNKYKIVFFVTLFGAFVLIAAWQGYSKYLSNQLQQQSAAYWQAMKAADGEARTAQLKELAKTGYKGNAMLANFALAETAVKNNKQEEALKYLKTISSNQTLQDYYRDLAVLYSGMITTSTNADAAKKYFTKLMDSKSAFKLSATELLANLEDTQGNKIEAINLYRSILLDSESSAAMKSRSQVRLKQLEQNS